MDWLHALALVATTALVAYLTYALLYPEQLS
jgi:K+-transporting ATPase KdpF subunit